MNEITLTNQIAEVRRELALRRNFYPHQVVRQKMSQAKADYQIAAIEAVLVSLSMFEPTEELRGLKPLVLYLANDADRDEVIAAIKIVKPDMIERKL